jgi:hypothetical protein
MRVWLWIVMVLLLDIFSKLYAVVCCVNDDGKQSLPICVPCIVVCMPATKWQSDTTDARGLSNLAAAEPITEGLRRSFGFLGPFCRPNQAATWKGRNQNSTGCERFVVPRAREQVRATCVFFRRIANASQLRPISSMQRLANYLDASIDSTAEP